MRHRRLKGLILFSVFPGPYMYRFSSMFQTIYNARLYDKIVCDRRSVNPYNADDHGDQRVFNIMHHNSEMLLTNAAGLKW